MYLVKVKSSESKIHGKGVFADQVIQKGETVWMFVEGHDKTLSAARYKDLTQLEKDHLDKVAYLSVTSNQYIFPPENDPALYTNHDEVNHNLSVVFNLNISPEPYFVANRSIIKGEELTNNYHEFDEAIKSKEVVPKWLK